MSDSCLIFNQCAEVRFEVSILLDNKLYPDATQESLGHFKDFVLNYLLFNNELKNYLKILVERCSYLNLSEEFGVSVSVFINSEAELNDFKKWVANNEICQKLTNSLLVNKELLDHLEIKRKDIPSITFSLDKKSYVNCKDFFTKSQVNETILPVESGISWNNPVQADNPEQLLTDAAKKFVHLLKKGMGGRDRIMLIGPQGYGKSSLVNTFATALLGQYSCRNAAGGSQICGNTKSYLCFRNCGLNELDDPANEVEKTLNDVRENLSKLIENEIDSTEWTVSCHLPEIWDTVGFPEEYREVYVEVLRRCLFGLVKDGENLNHMLNIAQEFGKETFEKQFPFIDDDSSQNRRITKLALVFDGSRKEFPEGLLQTVMEAVQPSDGAFKLSIPVFAIVTKKDLMFGTSSNVPIFEAIKRKIMDKIKIGGHEAVFYSEVINYCDSTAPKHSVAGYKNIARLDGPSLACLSKLINPDIRPRGLDQVPSDVKKQQDNQLRQRKTALNEMKKKENASQNDEEIIYSLSKADFKLLIIGLLIILIIIIFITNLLLRGR